MEDFITAKEAAELLEVSERAVRWYRQKRGLKGQEMFGRLVFLRADVLAFQKPKITGRPKKTTTEEAPPKAEASPAGRSRKASPKPAKKKKAKGA
jgi:hypothetical protein